MCFEVESCTLKQHTINKYDIYYLFYIVIYMFFYLNGSLSISIIFKWIMYNLKNIKCCYYKYIF